jgi:tRNA(fMet)-specific endonuclease VapC
VKYLLDTNVLVRLLRPRYSSVILRRLEQIGELDVAVCSIVRAELVTGALRSQHADHNLRLVNELMSNFESLPFDDRAADHAGRIRTELEGLGTPIGPNDLLIAAIAVSNGLTLVTHNITEFERVRGLAVADWEAGNS